MSMFSRSRRYAFLKAEWTSEVALVECAAIGGQDSPLEIDPIPAEWLEVES
jgi:hypothetical protein